MTAQITVVSPIRRGGGDRSSLMVPQSASLEPETRFAAGSQHTTTRTRSAAPMTRGESARRITSTARLTVVPLCQNLGLRATEIVNQPGGVTMLGI
jgi:hypothetical protein